VTIPAGIDDGTQIRLNREGEAGLNGGSPGDLYVLLDIQGHEVFQRSGNDIHVSIPVSVPQATLGATLEVATLEGDQRITIPAGTQPGDQIMLKNKGVPHLRSNRRGDQIVTVRVEVPKSLTEDQRRLFAALSESMGDEGVGGKGLFDKVKDVLTGD
jgi:molecular chaperone DnaJ